MVKELTIEGIKEKKKINKKLLIFVILPLVMVFGFFAVTATMYVIGNNTGTSPNFYQNQINSNNNSVGFTNGSYDEVANIDKDTGKITTRGNIIANYSTGGIGYFNWLGSSANRILQGWFNNIDISSTANATTFYENGNRLALNSSLSNYPLINNLAWNQSGSNIFLNTPSGNVGIGTTNPGATLDVNGVTRIFSGTQLQPGIVSRSYTDSGWYYWDNGVKVSMTWASSNSNTMTINGYGNVGIGTTNPGASLELYKSLATSSTEQQMMIINTDFGAATTTGFGGDIVFRGRTAGNLLQDNAKISAYNEDASNNGYALGFFTAPSAGVMSQRMTILRAGNVGIGTTNPNAKLTVNGMTNLSGNVNITGDLFINGIHVSNLGGSGINYWGSDGTNIYNLTARIGIGVLSPAYALEVNNLANALNISGMLYINSTYVGIGNKNFAGTGWSDSGTNFGIIGNNLGSGAIGATYNITGDTLGYLGTPNAGVYGTTAGYGYGVAGSGVGGSSIGVYGIGVGPSTIGGYFKSSSGTAIYAEGDANITQTLNVNRTNYVGGGYIYSNSTTLILGHT